MTSSTASTTTATANENSQLFSNSSSPLLKDCRGISSISINNNTTGSNNSGKQFCSPPNNNNDKNKPVRTASPTTTTATTAITAITASTRSLSSSIPSSSSSSSARSITNGSSSITANTSVVRGRGAGLLCTDNCRCASCQDSLFRTDSICSDEDTVTFISPEDEDDVDYNEEEPRLLEVGAITNQLTVGRRGHLCSSSTTTITTTTTTTTTTTSSSSSSSSSSSRVKVHPTEVDDEDNNNNNLEASIVNNFGVTTLSSGNNFGDDNNNDDDDDDDDEDDVVLQDYEDEDEDAQLEFDEVDLPGPHFRDTLIQFSDHCEQQEQTTTTPSLSSSSRYNANSVFNSTYRGDNNSSMGPWRAYGPPDSPRAISQHQQRPHKCPEIVIGRAVTGDSTLTWQATHADGVSLPRTAKITYYVRNRGLNDPTGLFHRWGLTAGRGDRLPTAVRDTFDPYINKGLMRFTMPSVFNMFSSMELEDNQDTDGSELIIKADE